MAKRNPPNRKARKRPGKSATLAEPDEWLASLLAFLESCQKNLPKPLSDEEVKLLNTSDVTGIANDYLKLPIPPEYADIALKVLSSSRVCTAIEKEINQKLGRPRKDRREYTELLYKTRYGGSEILSVEATIDRLANLHRDGLGPEPLSEKVTKTILKQNETAFDIRRITERMKAEQARIPKHPTLEFKPPPIPEYEPLPKTTRKK